METTYQIQQRLAGTKQAYWTLRVWTPGAECPIVHTGKGRQGFAYVDGIRKRRYPHAKRATNTGG